MEKRSIYIFLFLLQAIIHCVHPIIAQLPRPENVITRCKKGDFKSDAYNKNLDLALNSLSGNISNPEYTGFKSTQYGNPGELVNAVVLCPPYIKAEDCADCIKKSTQLIKKDCPKKKEAVVFTLISDLTSCMVRYGDYKIEGKFDDWAWVSFQSPKSGADIGKLQPTFRDMVNSIKEMAVTGEHGIRYAKVSASYGNSGQRVYLALQCTPDISQQDCSKCLNSAASGLKSNGIDQGKMSARRLSTHCYARYSHDPFFPEK
uniref:putative cysteine-rich receptor-like protein kinase 20 n=1 Tax=Erigeron canadensis TaxID=72917 RepID=UPI001CB93BC1|nr:putative cysteine-rich receptor-like protein kinase 20 [Erigeron canadensis]